MTLPFRFVPISLRELHEPSIYDPIGLLDLRAKIALRRRCGQAMETSAMVLVDATFLPHEHWREIMNLRVRIP